MFYRGVVENNNDPLKLGRLQVRVFGVHTDDKDELPTEALPFAEVANSLAFGFISGIGVSSVALQGSFVWIFFDNGDFNKPIVFATCPGISKEKHENAFSDTSGTYPLDETLGESDYNRLARAEKTEEIRAEKALQENIIQGISTADSSSWDEPTSLSKNAKYPFNNVIETQSGHIIQLDDTQGNERVQILHKSGSYIEIKPNGDVVIKSIQDTYEITKNNFKQNVGVKADLTINGDKSELIGGSLTENVGGALTAEVSKEYELTCGANYSLNVSQGMLLNAGTTTEIKGSIIKLN